MRKAIVVLGRVQELPEYKEVDWIGVDYGASFLASHHISMELAIGDFDSTEELDTIRKYAKETIVLPVLKEDTDSSAALKLLHEKGYTSIVLWGALGGRMDHELVNIGLLYRYPGVEIRSKHQVLKVLPVGKYCIQKEYKYLSFLTNDSCELSAEGLLYPLRKLCLTKEDLFATSNQFLQDEIKLIVEKGLVLCMQCEDEEGV
ncbi:MULTISPECIES: thiamine diphosphokinase [Terrabacteria group]|uniref:thiamine diphosphokinase n=1 Tax=Bacillati TaxID=1783272 RepID=UPI0019398100|nr:MULTISPECIES: thiamine diphosphokinase [Terrabacteria group]MBW9212371.1 thiamine diphosphokinase [Trueperella sp. zg.1013]QRG86096.1 thiamine diphosphokinase [Bulleidia sp. zg-1006]